jgi:glycosyltransferase involved in cell wall biosynthesis
LVIAGIIQDQRYFDDEVAPHIDGARVQYLGAIGPEQRRELLGGAHALLHLIDFDEPFGFSVVEAMACGTPVIAFDRGSMSELIDDGATGALVRDVGEAVQAVPRVAAFDRAAIRASTVRRFSRDRMVDDYVRVYEQVVASRLS